MIGHKIDSGHVEDFPAIERELYQVGVTVCTFNGQLPLAQQYCNVD